MDKVTSLSSLERKKRVLCVLVSLQCYECVSHCVHVYYSVCVCIRSRAMDKPWGFAGVCMCAIDRQSLGSNDKEDGKNKQKARLKCPTKTARGVVWLPGISWGRGVAGPIRPLLVCWFRGSSLGEKCKKFSVNWSFRLLLLTGGVVSGERIPLEQSSQASSETMCVCVCMCACVHVCMCVCVCLCLCTCSCSNHVSLLILSQTVDTWAAAVIPKPEMDVYMGSSQPVRKVFIQTKVIHLSDCDWGPNPCCWKIWESLSAQKCVHDAI